MRSLNLVPCFLLLAGCAAKKPMSAWRGQGGPAREIVLSLDGVSIEVIHAARARGLYSALGEPAAMVSPFPSLTLPGHADIWTELPVRGYEDRYFDVAADKLTGGLMARLTNAHAEKFQERYELTESKFAGAAVYIARRSVTRRALADLERYLLAPGPARRVALLNATDPVSHAADQEELLGVLAEVDRILDRARTAAHGDLRVTLFSDHGNADGAAKRAAIDRALGDAGFRLGGRLARAGQAVIASYGLVSFAAIHVLPVDRARAVGALRDAEGVAFVATSEDGGVSVASTLGTARVDRRGCAYRYLASTGDPLGLGGVLMRLRQRGALDQDGFANERAWLEETAGHEYPDAPRRLWRGMYEEFLNPAPIVVSLAPGYHYGPKLFSHFVNLKRTHGSLSRAASLGFLMTNWTETPAMVRSDEMRPYLYPPPPTPAWIARQSWLTAGSGGER